ncbi:hypothetical protein M8312_05620 [Sphingomonas sp. KRR8]|nr:hypothetical protein M8312_05620 [Sphingomonas sp. KRR8]
MLLGFGLVGAVIRRSFGRSGPRRVALT